MSEFWTRDTAAAAATVSPFAPPALGTFTAWGAGRFAGSSSFVEDETVLGGSVSMADGIVDPAAIHADAFAEGHAEGLRTLEEAIRAERAAVARLAESLANLQPEPAGPLAALLAATVERLVRQVVGEVRIDSERLLERATAAAALIADEGAPARMRVHPDDHDRLVGAALPVALVADPNVAPGAVLVEGDQGWIEDGPEAALERLAHALDRMGIA